MWIRKDRKLLMKYLIWIVYVFLISGLCLIVWPYLRIMLLSRRANKNILSLAGGRVKRRLKIMNGPVSRHVYHKLMLVFPNCREEYLLVFYLLSALSAVLAFMLTSRGASLGLASIFCSVMLFLPYGIILIRLRLIQVMASHEGDVMINELLSNYAMSYRNMHEAIERTAVSLEDNPTSQMLLMQLSARLQRTGDEEEIREIVGLFRESIATSWAKILSMNIVIALSLGLDVEPALRDLNKSISDAKKMGEYRRRQNNEAVWMLKYLAPASYLFTIILSVKYFDFTISKFISYQFDNPLGLGWFCIISVLYLLGIFLTVFLTKKRMDV